MPLKPEELKAAACSAIDSAAQELNSLSQDIWNHPELAFEERHAHQALTDFLDRHGFPVERHHVLETAFRAVLDHGGNSGGTPTAAVLCEYDALPAIGHACGHNLIAEVGIGAALGIKAALEEARKAEQNLGKLHVLGTPAEEGGGGKCKLIQANTFKDVDFAVMSHGANCSRVITDQQFICRLLGKVTFKGKASHAAAFPWEGVNALDAAVMAYNSISVLRQQIKPDWRVHAIITNGGVKPNIIPELSEMEVGVRCLTRAELDVLQEKVARCFQAAATATGCTVDIKWETDTCYLNMLTSRVLAELYERNIRSSGVPETPEDSERRAKELVGSTDMGNVSYEVPSLHPIFYIGSDEAIHTRAFTTDAGDPKAQPHTIAQAKALAMTVIDVYCKPDLVATMREDLETDKSKAAAAK